MLDAFLGHYAYWGAIVLLGVGLYTVTASANLVKKVMGLSIFQSAVFVLYISIGAVENATAPIVDPSHGAYANPLPHVLILTAIVVGVATAALALALVVRIHAACGSVEEDDIARALQASGPAWATAGAVDGAEEFDGAHALGVSDPIGIGGDSAEEGDVDRMGRISGTARSGSGGGKEGDEDARAGRVSAAGRSGGGDGGGAGRLEVRNR